MIVLSFTKDKYLVMATFLGDIILWDLETFERSNAVKIHKDTINDLRECTICFRLRSCFITGSSDHSLKIMSLRMEDEQFVEILQLKTDQPVGAVAELRNYIVVGAAKTKMLFWSLDNIEQPLAVIETHT